MRYTSMRYTHEVYVCGVYVHKVHACETYDYEIYACEVHAHETSVYHCFGGSMAK